ncbi:MAG: 8-oxo-dGTP diphosphatase MutT, partial [Candidatus Rokubacteria bacterium]|nr:8-oxo-dGTP diphosphatase MutT [Candidatus Rokubacteria bacterium]
TSWEYPERKVIIHFFRCEIVGGAIGPTEGQAFRWVPPRELSGYDFPPADAELVRELSRQPES